MQNSCFLCEYVLNCNLFLYFQHHYSSLQCHMIFRNHNNMLLEKHFWLLSMLNLCIFLEINAKALKSNFFSPNYGSLFLKWNKTISQFLKWNKTISQFWLYINSDFISILTLFQFWFYISSDFISILTLYQFWFYISSDFISILTLYQFHLFYLAIRLNILKFNLYILQFCALFLRISRKKMYTNKIARIVSPNCEIVLFHFRNKLP